jgi:GntR family transcriptional regulator
MPEPMWRRIAEDLRQKIESGELGGGGKALPSELELREEYEASRNTVRDAVKWLVTRGLVVTRPGQGTYVTNKIDPFVTVLSPHSHGDSAAYISDVGARSRTGGVSVPRIEIQQTTSGLVADELRLAEGTSVVSRHQERFIDGTPWSLQTTFYPMLLVDQGAGDLIKAKDIDTGAVGYIEATLGIKQIGWRDRITVRPPDAREVEFFGLPDDGRIAVFEIIRTSYDESGTPIRVTITTYPTDRNQFVMTAGEVPIEELPEPSGPGVSGLSDG